jgi:predicted small secreted protein
MRASQLAVILTVLCAFVVASCANTVRGIGRDLNETARAIEDTVE